jgi:hypothetical protein
MQTHHPRPHGGNQHGLSNQRSGYRGQSAEDGRRSRRSWTRHPPWPSERSAFEISRLPGLSQHEGTVASALGHSKASLISGVTNDYIGDAENVLWNLRRESPSSSRSDPLIASQPFQPWHSSNNITEYGALNAIGSLSRETIRQRLILDTRKSWEKSLTSPPQDEDLTLPPLPAVTRGATALYRQVVPKLTFKAYIETNLNTSYSNTMRTELRS